MSKFEERMEEIFDIAPIENTAIIPNPKSESTSESLDVDLKTDYQIARDNFQELIDKGKEAFDDILAISKDSEKARDFEVAATLFKNIVEANEKMIDLHKKMREIASPKSSKHIDNTNTTINNALFVGSTTDLLKTIKQINNENNIIEH